MRNLKEIDKWTVDDFEQAHKELWMAISELPDDTLTCSISRIKNEAFMRLFPDYKDRNINIDYKCFACEIMHHIPIYDCANRRCPIDWDGDGGFCLSHHSPYKEFVGVRHEVEYLRELAVKIANLPFRRFEEGR